MALDLDDLAEKIGEFEQSSYWWWGEKWNDMQEEPDATWFICNLLFIINKEQEKKRLTYYDRQERVH